MKTSELVNVLAANIDSLALAKESINLSNPANPSQALPGLRIFGLIEFKKAVAKIEEAKLLPQQIKQLKETILYQTGQDTVTINWGEGSVVSAKVDAVILIANQLYNALAETVKIQDADSINIKLPEKLKDFNDLEKFSHDIHLALNQTINEEEIGGHIEITGVENGSIWLQVCLGSAAAVMLVGNLVWAAMVIYKKKQEANLLAQQVRSLGIRNESVDEIQKAQKDLLNQMVTAEATYVSDENYKTASPERIERLKHSIELFSKLISQGTEIYPALAAPEHVSNLFPNAKNILGISSKIMQIDKQ